MKNWKLQNYILFLMTIKILLKMDPKLKLLKTIWTITYIKLHNMNYIINSKTKQNNLKIALIK